MNEGRNKRAEQVIEKDGKLNENVNKGMEN